MVTRVGPRGEVDEGVGATGDGYYLREVERVVGVLLLMLGVPSA